MASNFVFPMVLNTTAPYVLKGEVVRSIEEIPYIVQVRETRGDIVCGGTIISAFLILTAAHCVYGIDPSTLEVVAGELKLWPGSKAQTRKVTRAIKHDPPYTPGIYSRDIIILELSSALDFNDRVKNVTLWNIHPPTTGAGYARIYGWGLNELDERAETLLKAWVWIHPTEFCRRSHPEQAEFFVREMFCARGINGAKGTASCQGDSGSPIVCLDRPVRLCGLTSFGEGKHCSRTTKPVAYVNVIYHLPWILSVIEGHHPPSYSSCAANEFRCKNGRCILKIYKCNKMDDCGDWSDENCAPASNSVSAYKCTEKPIPGNHVCDGIVDCTNGSDEYGCGGCQHDEVSCNQKCYKTTDFCYFEREDTDNQFGPHFGTCTRVHYQWRPSYNRTTTRYCEVHDGCGAEYRCVRCSINVKCSGNCQSSLEVCELRKRLRW